MPPRSNLGGDTGIADAGGQPAGHPGRMNGLRTKPTGAHDAYYAGDKITYNGKHYVCIMPEN